MPEQQELSEPERRTLALAAGAVSAAYRGDDDGVGDFVARMDEPAARRLWLALGEVQGAIEGADGGSDGAVRPWDAEWDGSA